MQQQVQEDPNSVSADKVISHLQQQIGGLHTQIAILQIQLEEARSAAPQQEIRVLEEVKRDGKQEQGTAGDESATG